MHPKQKVHLNEKYLKWVREKSCVTCGAPPPSQAHHVFNSGKQNHGNDYLAVALCHSCHISGPRAYHRVGHESFERAWNIELKDTIINSLSDFLDQKGT